MPDEHGELTPGASESREREAQEESAFVCPKDGRLCGDATHIPDPPCPHWIQPDTAGANGMCVDVMKAMMLNVLVANVNALAKLYAEGMGRGRSIVLPRDLA